MIESPMHPEVRRSFPYDELKAKMDDLPKKISRMRELKEQKDNLESELETAFMPKT